MQVIINGKPTVLAEPITVATLLQQLDIDGKVAVEINRTIIPRSTFAHHRINDGDTLEIVRAIGGG
jgi:thiamine biosynthesis protein ThiS